MKNIVVLEKKTEIKLLKDLKTLGALEFDELHPRVVNDIVSQ